MKDETIKGVLDTLQNANDTIRSVRRYLPKSIHNVDRFAFELTAAKVAKAIHTLVVEEGVR